MRLAAGARLGPYEITGPLGAGGMGEVYRARDSRLARDVAVKVLTEKLATDPASVARFEREARAVAVLSHPNILAIHELDHEGGLAFAVMELIEGTTLRARLTDGPLPPRVATDVAVQIARGLAAAHDKGVVHRDLKPENVLVTPEGRVKILDFGLARMEEPPAPDPGLDLPTGPRYTEPGHVMGTVGYMSPEHVRGQAVDHRTDIFALGIVLHEMLTGRRPFERETPAETVAAVLRDDPPEPAPGPALPAALHRIARRCLEKGVEQRFQSAHDLAFALETALVSPSATAASVGARSAGRLRPRADVLAALAFGLLLGAAAVFWSRPPVPTDVVMVRPLTYSGRDLSPAAAPDGRTLAFASERDGARRIWLKDLASGSEAALTAGPDDEPRFSPDGSAVLFVRTDGGRTSLMRVPVLGGEPRRLADDALSADWTPDGRRVVFVRHGLTGSLRVSTVHLAEADGSGAKDVVRLPGLAVRWPRVSPDGATVALVDSGLGGAAGGVLLVELATGSHRRLPVPDGGVAVAAAWSGTGEELLTSLSQRGRGSRIVRQPIAGGASPTLLWAPSQSGQVDVLGPGRVVFETVATRENLRLIEKGATRWLTRGQSADRQPVFAPDGASVAFTSTRSGNLDIWSLTLATGALRRLTEHEAEDWDPSFTADGRLLWSSARSGNLEVWMAEADGTAPRQVTRDGVDAQNPTATRDGQWILYRSGNPEKAGLWKVRPDGKGARRLVTGTAALPEVSPDGRYVLYLGGASGSGEAIRVARVEDGAPSGFEIPITVVRPSPIRMGRARWMPDGRAIAFVGQDAHGVHGVFVQDFAPFRDTAKTRRVLGGLETDTETESFAVAPDGRLVVASWERLLSVMVAEGLGGVAPPSRPRR